MSWQIDPKTGDYIMTNGRPTDDSSLIYPAYYRIKVSRTKWLYAPDVNYGSDFWTVRKNFTSQDASKLANLADKALQPITDDGRASDIEVDILSSRGRNDAQLSVQITDASGKTDTLNLPIIGG